MAAKPTYEALEQRIKQLETELEAHKTFEIELNKSNKKYRELYRLTRLMADNAPDLLWAKDMEDRHIFVNRAGCEKLLKASNTREPIGKKHLYFAKREREQGHIHTFGEQCEDSDAVVKKIKRARRFIEEGFVREDYLVLDVNKAPIFDDKGEMIGTVGCGRDIGHERAMQNALEESERRFRHIIEDVSEISIQGYDEERKVTFWNRASELIYGYTEEEALGKKLEDLIIPPPMRQTVKTLHRRWITHGEKIPAGELTLMDKAGNEVNVFSSHVMNDTQTGKEMFCIDIDLSPIKKAEREKNELQEQLIHSQKMEAVGSLTSGIAHDFNNILQVIGGFTDYLTLQQVEDEQMTNGLVEIRKATDRAMDLIQRLMAFSRKTSVLKNCPTKTNIEVKRAQELMKNIIPKMIRIETHLPNEVMDVNVDPVQIEQIILNLGTNAADAMPDGGTISISTANRVLHEVPAIDRDAPHLSGDFVELSFTDTGHGMDEATQEQIFNPFFTTKPSGKGTGLGLASVYGIVKTNGGLVRCESRPGRGTTFKIYFPAVSVRSKGRNHMKSNPMVRGTETILMVDDEASIITFVSKALTLFGYTFLSASSGEAALEIIHSQKTPIDLVLLDINMPGMGGQQCLRKITEMAPDLKVIVSSGYSDDPIISTCLASGAVSYLKKPYKIPTMLTLIRDVIDEK